MVIELAADIMLLVAPFMLFDNIQVRVKRRPAWGAGDAEGLLAAGVHIRCYRRTQS